jgi:HTH-type transcriptional regulator / antitoxin HigA
MRNMTKTIGKMTNGLTDTASYTQLVVNFPPRPIRSEAELATTQAVVDGLLDAPNLTPAQQDYLNVLGTLIAEFEQTLGPLPDISGVELLKVLMAERELRQKDLVPIFKTESIISDVLHGRRKLTVEHIEKLAKFFHVSAAVFFPA